MEGRSAASVVEDGELRERQLSKLRAAVPELLRCNPFYRERLHAVESWDDFQRLPFTTKEELVADHLANPPFGTNLTYPLDRYVRIHQTSGTGGGSPLRWLDTAESWAWWQRIWAEKIYPSAGISAPDRIFFAFSFGPFIGFWSAFAGAEKLGAMLVPGGSMSTVQRVLTLTELGATVLCCTPTYALRLAETAAQEGIDLRQAGLRCSIHAGEPGASIPATRSAIESALGVTAYDHTGMTELGPTGVSCSQRDGVHLFEDEFIFEVKDGELVATNLGRWGSPLIRYRTGDRLELSREACSCGSPFVKAVGGLLGRVDDMITVRGVNVFPSQVEEVVRRRPGVTEFIIECRKLRQMDEATVVVEIASGADGGAVAEAVVRELGAVLGVRLECRAVPPGTLPRSELKAKRLRRIDD